MMISYRHTYAVILKLKSSLKRIFTTVDIIMQLLFIIYYIYLLGAKSGTTLFIVIYSILIGVSSLFFIFNIITLFIHNKEFNKKIKTPIRKITKYSKFLIRAFIIGYDIYYIVKYSTTDLNKIITVVSLVLLISQIIFEIIITFINHYIDLFVESIKWDYEESPALRKVVDIVNPKDDAKPSFVRKVASAIGKKMFTLDENENVDENLSDDSIKKRKKIKEFEEKYEK